MAWRLHDAGDKPLSAKRRPQQLCRFAFVLGFHRFARCDVAARHELTRPALQLRADRHATPRHYHECHRGCRLYREAARRAFGSDYDHLGRKQTVTAATFDSYRACLHWATQSGPSSHARIGIMALSQQHARSAKHERSKRLSQIAGRSQVDASAPMTTVTQIAPHLQRIANEQAAGPVN